ncbi:hypothetical protein COBT_003740, partial [Conglomerata obtusa]
MLFFKDIFAIKLDIDLNSTKVTIVSEFSCSKNINNIELLFIIFYEGKYAEKYDVLTFRNPTQKANLIRKTLLLNLYNILLLQLNIEYYNLDVISCCEKHATIEALDKAKISIEQNSFIYKDA